jgi:hypothetical protein
MSRKVKDAAMADAVEASASPASVAPAAAVATPEEDAPPNVPAPAAPAPTRVQAIGRGKVVALTNITRSGGNVRAGTEFEPESAAEHAELLAHKCIKDV